MIKLWERSPTMDAKEYKQHLINTYFIHNFFFQYNKHFITIEDIDLIALRMAKTP